MISFSRNSWRCCLHTLSCRVRFPIPKGLIMIHLPTHFPPPFSSPCQDQAGSGIQQAHTAEYGVGEGAEEKIGVTLWFLIKIAENRINCKQRGLEGSYQTLVGFGWQNPRAAVGFSLGWEGMEPWQKGKVSSLSASHAASPGCVMGTRKWKGFEKVSGHPSNPGGKLLQGVSAVGEKGAGQDLVQFVFLSRSL